MPKTARALLHLPPITAAATEKLSADPAIGTRSIQPLRMAGIPNHQRGNRKIIAPALPLGRRPAGRVKWRSATWPCRETHIHWLPAMHARRASVHAALSNAPKQIQDARSGVLRCSTCEPKGVRDISIFRNTRFSASITTPPDRHSSGPQTWPPWSRCPASVS